MKTKFLINFILFLFNMSLFADNQEVSTSHSILIIGGGPAGLATAIEAKAQGHHVVIVEKRESYSRPQRLFLFDVSLKLLEKWGVDASPIRIADLGDGNLVGFVPIKQLEDQLETRALAMGVEKVIGAFEGIQANQTAMIATRDNKKIALPYHIIIGADGPYSEVRKSLGIEINILGAAKCATAIFPDMTDTSVAVDISPALEVSDGFLRRIKVPRVSIVFMQFPFSATRNDLQRIMEVQGWNKEVTSLVENLGFLVEDRDVYLQQSCSFFDERRSALLVGDAAATASFFQGMGANTALKGAEAAGNFFKEMKMDKKKAFQNFNQAMKEMTDAMIEDSAYLFTQECVNIIPIK